jgi:hypothetical protein
MTEEEKLQWKRKLRRKWKRFKKKTKKLARKAWRKLRRFCYRYQAYIILSLAVLILLCMIGGIVHAVKSKKQKSLDPGASGSVQTVATITDAQEETTEPELQEGDGFTQEELEAEHPLLLQADVRWGNLPYGSSTVGTSGCAPTSLSMVILALTHNPEATPDQVAEFSNAQGYYINDGGTSWTLMSEGSKSYGLDVVEVPLVEGKMKSKLDEGAMIIINVKPGVFSEHGHYAVLYGYTEEGFLVNDPYSADNSSRAWSYAELEDGIRNIWAFTAAATESEEATEAETVTEP